MSEEILRILKMVREGKISEEEGATLIDSLKEENQEKGTNYQNFFEDKMDNLKSVLRNVKDSVSNVLEDVFKGIDLKNIDFSGSFFKGKFKRTTETNKVINQSVKNIEIKIPKGNIKIIGTDKDFKLKTNTEIRNDSEEILESEINLVPSYINEFNDTLRIEIPKEKQTRIKVDIELFIPKKIDINVFSLSSDLIIENIDGEINLSSFNGDFAGKNLNGKLSYITKSGDIQINHIKGTSEVKTLNGDISISVISGTTNISTKSGDLMIEDLKGKIEASTLSGDIEAKKIEGEIKLKSFAGDVEAYDITSNLISVETLSGDIEIKEILINENKGSFKSLSGDIEIKFNKNSGGSLLLRAYTGEISVDGDLKSIKRERTELEGTFNDGNSQIDIETKSGDISVRI